MTPPPALAGRYALGELLGRGGMADVHRAVDLRLGREVAVKVLRAGVDSPGERARFRSEIAVLARLNHPAVVQLLDAGAEEDRSFLVMELVDGPTLRQVQRAGPMTSERVTSIGAQLAAALAYAHSLDVVHRDVKPGNVLLDADTGHHGSRARLGDFGIARVLGDTLRHTQTGMAVGTAAYLSPEQVTGEDAGPASDVYSLGLVLLESLSGSHPFPGSAPESMAARLHRAPVVPDTLTPAWRRLLGEMTSTDPAARPSAAAVAVELALTPTQAIAPVPAPPPTRVLPPLPPAGSAGLATLARSPLRSRGALVVAGVLAALVVGAGLTLGRGAEAGDGPTPPSTSSSAEPDVVPARDGSPTSQPAAPGNPSSSSGTGGSTQPATSGGPSGGPGKAKPDKGKSKSKGDDEGDD